MSAPSEQEIRAAIEAYVARYPAQSTETIADAVDDMASILDTPVQDLLGDDPPDPAVRIEPWEVWTDLRPSEAFRLEALSKQAKLRAAERCRAIIVDELTTAALAFAAEYPDAPRPKVPA